MLVVKRGNCEVQNVSSKETESNRENDKEKEYMRDSRGSRESGENLIESKNGLN